MHHKNIIVETQMLIRKPVKDVFIAFIDPVETVNFWFTKSSGKLEEGKTVTWQWEMYGVSTETRVTKLIENKLIVVEWGEPKETVEFHFRPSADGDATYVQIKNYGFAEADDALSAKLIDTTGGFTTVLDGAKCWLEHGFNLNLIGDKFPREFISHG